MSKRNKCTSVGIDVHKNKLTCVFQEYKPNEQAVEEDKPENFATTVTDIQRFVTWVKERNPQVVLMESTGIYWLVPYTALEDAGIKAEVVNPRDVKASSGRKTDARDARRLAEHARMGDYNSSFIPSKQFRYIREIGRSYNKSLEERKKWKNRLVRKMIALGCNTSSIFAGKISETSIEIITSFLDDSFTDFKNTVYSARALKNPPAQIIKAFPWNIKKEEKELLKYHLIKYLTARKECISLCNLLEKALKPHKSLLDGLVENLSKRDTLSKVSRTQAMKILSELDTNLDSFATVNRFCSWVGVCPGNHISADKNYSSKMPQGNKYLKSYLQEPAYTAVKAERACVKINSIMEERKTRRHLRNVKTLKLTKAVYAILRNSNIFCV